MSAPWPLQLPLPEELVRRGWGVSEHVTGWLGCLRGIYRRVDLPGGPAVFVSVHVAGDHPSKAGRRGVWKMEGWNDASGRTLFSRRSRDPLKLAASADQELACLEARYRLGWRP